MRIILGQNSHELVRQSFQGPGRGSRPEFVGGFKDVYRRQGIRGYMANIRPSKWNLGNVWLGNFNTAREAACVRDAVLFYTGQDLGYDYPDLKETFLPLPPHFRLDSFEDHEKIKNFVMKQAQEAACRVNSSGKGCGSLNRRAVLNEGGKIEHVDSKVDADSVTAVIAANKIGKYAVPGFCRRS